MKTSKINIIKKIQQWMNSEAGQTFLNYAYSWGAAVVILGALFKITHISGADFMLFLGMGTEVIVFFLSAFDSPFKGATEIEKENVTPQVPFSPGMEHYERLTRGDNGISNVKNETFDNIDDAYRQQLARLEQQMGYIDEVDEQLKTQAQKISELNKIYGRMLSAVKGEEKE